MDRPRLTVATGFLYSRVLRNPCMNEKNCNFGTEKA